MAADVDVIVVGGGLAGLFTALELRRRGTDVALLDEGDAPGGIVRSESSAGYRVEPAAGTLMLPHPVLSPILATAEVDVRPAPAAARRFVFTRGRLVEVRPGPGLLAAPLVSPMGKLSALMEPLRRSSGTSDESLSRFLERRLGREAGGLAAWLMASGVFAGEPERLSAVAAFPALGRLEREAGSLVVGGLRRLRPGAADAPRPTPHVPVGGMAEMAARLAGSLGAAVRSGFRVQEGRRDGSLWAVEGPETLRARRLVVATPPHRAAKLLGGDLGAILETAVYAPVAVVALGGGTDRLPLPDGFGYLTGPDTGFVGVGCLFESSIDPDRAPEGRSLARVIAGGATRPDVVDWDDARLVTRVGEEVARALARDVEVEFTSVIRHRPGIPQYEMGHSRWLAGVDAARSTAPGLFLTGWGYRGVGVAHVAADASAVAARAA